MTSIVTDFKSIRRKLERQEQKAEFEAKNPKVEPSMYGWPYGVAVPMADPHDWKPVLDVLDAWGVKI
ncbi:hypothetical protein QIH93_15005 [Bradyrhizobium ottawaense]|uniref:hypothetical protein n=1 Tax=Bradyrhizobium ottawaense TaxID=931866 RepID=UPI002714A9F5|nr:hypothetical protein [Bradyrhizobium ottawaense]WLB49221.1 hypothetical protein QIH93_15005 [Bradyrhizobium ottawaense]